MGQDITMMNNNSIKNLNLMGLDKISQKKRKQMYDYIARAVNILDMSLVLDVGATTQASLDSSNYFEHYFPHKNRIITLSTENPLLLQRQFSELHCVQGDGRQLPFRDGSIDMVFSSAVIEHTGTRTQQKTFLEESYRVAKNYVVFTTPNRWHPLEFHTYLPLLHWLPKPLHRKLLKCAGFDFYALEENLNLFSRNDIKKMCKSLNIPNYKLQPIYWLGFISNWIVVLQKESSC